MQRPKVLRITVCAVLATASLSAGVWATDVEPGCDVFQTPPGGAFLDFDPVGVGIIPADFFGPGSDPFYSYGSPETLEGVPLGTHNGNDTGDGDTVVERLETAILPGGGDSDTIDIELVALSLKGINPITVTFNGGQDPEQWDISSVELSDSQPSLGTMTIFHDNFPDGGVFTTSIDVFVKLTFTKVGDPGNVQVLDTGNFGVPDNVNNLADPAPWSHTRPAGQVTDPCGSGSFAVTAPVDHKGPHPETVPATGEEPGPICGDNVVNQSSEECDGTDDAACPGQCRSNCTCPPPPPVTGRCCSPEGSCEITTQAQCNSQAGVFGGAGTTCEGDSDNNGIDDACEAGGVPTASAWGMMILVAALLMGIAIKFGFRRRSSCG